MSAFERFAGVHDSVQGAVLPGHIRARTRRSQAGATVPLILQLLRPVQLYPVCGDASAARAAGPVALGAHRRVRLPVSVVRAVPVITQALGIFYT